MKRAPVTPSLFTPSVTDAVRFYEDRFGFQQTGRWQDEDEPVTWAAVSLNDAKIWFFLHPLPDRPAPVFSGLIYVFIDDVDAMATRLQTKMSVEWGPQTQGYGLRELGVKDLNGYYLVFAKDVED